MSSPRDGATDVIEQAPLSVAQEALWFVSLLDPKRLSYHEQREWDAMEQTILEAEQDLERCKAALTDPAVISDAAELARRYTATEAATARV